MPIVFQHISYNLYLKEAETRVKGHLLCVLLYKILLKEYKITHSPNYGHIYVAI